MIDNKGNPIDDALIEPHRGNSFVHETRTGDDGRSVVEDVGVGWCELVINKSGYARITVMVVIYEGSLARFDSMLLQKTPKLRLYDQSFEDLCSSLLHDP